MMNPKDRENPRIRNKEGKRMIIHPFLFALYPVLFLYANNIEEVYLPQPVFPLLLALLFAATWWGGLFLVVRDKVKSALISTLFIFLFFAYGHTFDQLKFLGQAFNLDIPRDFYLLPLFFILWAILFYRIKKTQKSLKTLTTFLNIISLGLVLFNTFNISLFEMKRAQSSSFKAHPQEKAERAAIPSEDLDLKKSPLPDIYYIILDEYAALGTIKDLYGYDGSAFAQGLRELGFFIATGSRTRYNLTEKSLASSLNMDYLPDQADCYAMIRDNRVVDILKQAGYKIINFPVKAESVFTRSDLVFDFSPEKKSTWINDFYMTLFKTTMLRVLYEWFINEKYYSYYFREKILYILHQLESLPPLKGPKFVHAHIVCPHWPFVFDRDGGLVDPRHLTDVKNKKYYLDQYIFISAKIKHLAEVLIKKSPSPPVIVVQSDHGPRGFGPGGGYYQLEVGNEWQRIFNAYYLPGKNHRGLYPSISPVNTFRLIFNHYLGTAYPLL